jgi:uncharacterized membrane protein
MGTNKQQGINQWLSIILWINIVWGGIRGFINAFNVMLFSWQTGVFTLVVTIIGVIALINLLSAKKWAFFLWITYIVVYSAFNYYISGGNTLYLILPVFSIIIMCVLLQLRKDGVSAWSRIFGEKKENQGKNNGNTKKRLLKEHSISESGEETDVSSIVPDKNIEKDSAGQDEIEKNNRKINSRLKFPKITINQGLGCLFVTVIVAIGLNFIYQFFTNSNMSKFVYIDEKKVLHINRNCANLVSASYIDTLLLRSYHCKKLCTVCVSDRAAQEIEELILRHSQEESSKQTKDTKTNIERNKAETPNSMTDRYNPFEKKQGDMFNRYDNRRRNLYEGAQKLYGNDFMSYDDFLYNLADANKRRNLYDNIQKRKPMKHKSFDEFSNFLGYTREFEEKEKKSVTQ